LAAARGGGIRGAGSSGSLVSLLTDPQMVECSRWSGWLEFLVAYAVVGTGSGGAPAAQTAFPREYP